jgi:VCBS repeat-containing protein
MAARARPRRLFVQTLEARDVPTNFQIVSLGTAGTVTTTHDTVTGPDWGGIALSSSKVMVTGSIQTGVFDRTTLAPANAPPPFGPRYDAIVSDLHTQKVYVFGVGTQQPFQYGVTGALADRLIEVDGATGQLTTNEVALNQGGLAVQIPLGFDTGLFAGYDRLVVHPFNGAVYEILPTTGQVNFLTPGLATPFPHQLGAGWAYFGTAEHFGGGDYLDYVASTETIARERVSDSQIGSLATFADPGGQYLGNMATFTVSPTTGRWYFHHKGWSLFRPSADPNDQVLGYAGATFQVGDFLVTNTNPGGPGSLRQAITDANNAPGPDTIGFAANVSGTIDLSATAISVTDAVSVAGPGSGTITVAGSGANTLFAASAGVGLTLSGLTLLNPNGLTVPYSLTAAGDLVASAGTGNVKFTNFLGVSGGTLTVIDGNAVDLGPSTTVNGVLSAANGVTVAAGQTLDGFGGVAAATTVAGTLGGSPTVTGNVTVQNGGTIAPESAFLGIGTVTVNGDVTFLPGGTFTAEAASAGANDRLTVHGTVNLGTTGNPLKLVLGYAPSPDDSFLVIDNDDTDAVNGFLTGPFGPIRNRSGYQVGGTYFQVRYDGRTGNDLELIANSAPVLDPDSDVHLAPMLEDVPTNSNVGTTVDALVHTGGLYADRQGLFRSGLAFTALDNAHGSWQFSTSGGSSWTGFGTVSATSAVVLEADGNGQNRVRFRPAANYFGSATMSFRAWDAVDGRPDGSTGVDTSAGGGNNPFGTETKSATIDVLAVDDPPAPADDAYGVNEDATLSVGGPGVLANDADIDGPFPLTAGLVGGPAHGSLALNADGSFTYTPNSNYSGSDSFTYKSIDGDGAYGVGVVHLTVNPVNDNPTAADDTVVLPEDGGPAPIGVLANDSSAPDSGETLTVTAATAPAHGTATIAPGGQSVVYTSARDYNGTDSFTYTASDGNGGTATATVNITVTSVNDSPVATNDSANLMEDAGAQSIGVLANDTTGPDTGETLTVSAVTPGLHGTVTIGPGGLTVLYTPDANFAGPDQFIYTVFDGNGGTASAAVVVNVANDAADRLEVVTSPGTAEWDEVIGGAPQPVPVDPGVQIGAGLEGVLTGATVKIASGFVAKKDTLTFATFVTPTGGQIKGKYDPAKGILKLSGVGSPADYQAALRTVQYVNPSPAPVDGVRTITVQVQDAAGLGDPAYRLLKVVGRNTAPVLTLPSTLAPARFKLGKPAAVAVAGPLKVVDVDNTRLQGATVTIMSTPQAGDMLTINKLTSGTVSGIGFSYSAGVLTLTGNATLATYLKVLKLVKFAATGGTGVNRTLEFKVFDGDLWSTGPSRTVTVA